MSLVSTLLLVVVLLPSLLAVRITFGEGKEAEYELLECEPFKGSQGIIIFAKFVSSSPGFNLENSNEVALKISYPDKTDYLHYEQKAHNFIRDADQKLYNDYVAKAEKWLGTSMGSNEDINNVAVGIDKQDEYLVLVMERMDTDLQELFSNNKIEYPGQEMIYDRFCTISEWFESIGFVHGDIKPENILFSMTSGMIKVTDLGLSIFNGGGMAQCGGDLAYVSPIQHILQRNPTQGDCAWSGASSFLFLAIEDLPWHMYVKDLELPGGPMFYDLHLARIMVAKYEFLIQPFTTCKDILPKTFEDKIRNTITNSFTKEEIGSIKKQIDSYIENISKSKTDKKPIPMIYDKSCKRFEISIQEV